MTSHISLLPDKDNLRRICKAISVISAIISPNDELRCHHYNARWGEGEELFEAQNGSGDQLLILFREEGCAINIFCHEPEQPPKHQVLEGLPVIFNEFFSGEPVKSIGTTLCMWTDANGRWQMNEGSFSDATCMKETLNLFDGKVSTYLQWANEYFDESFKEKSAQEETIKKIYAEIPLTKQMVHCMTDEAVNWEKLQSDMEEIDYITHFI
jgi:hypothetical protein